MLKKAFIIFCALSFAAALTHCSKGGDNSGTVATTLPPVNGYGYNTNFNSNTCYQFDGTNWHDINGNIVDAATCQGYFNNYGLHPIGPNYLNGGSCMNTFGNGSLFVNLNGRYFCSFPNYNYWNTFPTTTGIYGYPGVQACTGFWGNCNLQCSYHTGTLLWGTIPYQVSYCH